MDWNSITKELQAKLDSGAVKTRVQGGAELQYIEGWHAIAEANRIFGFGNWDRISNVSLIKEVEGKDRRGNLQWRVSYLGKCTISVGNTKRDGHGYGSGIAADLGQAHEGAIKEAETDAMKRAFMTFGNPFGLALYDKDRAGVDYGEPINQMEEVFDSNKIVANLGGIKTTYDKVSDAARSMIDFMNGLESRAMREAVMENNPLIMAALKRVAKRDDATSKGAISILDDMQTLIDEGI